MESFQMLFKKEQGVALITVLFLFALATVIVSSLVILLNSSVVRASAVLESQQASLLCLSGEEWARQILSEDYRADIDVDHTHEKWAEDGKLLDVDNGYIEVSIADAQAKFNLNNIIDGAGLTNQNGKIALQRLINFSLEDQQLSTTLADQAADWMDKDSSGIEAQDYLSEPIPYKPPNSKVDDVSELRWLKDMDQKSYKILYQDMFPQLTALPKISSININTVSPSVLAALGGISLAEAESLVKDIQSQSNGSEVPANLQITPSPVTYSEYFEVRIRAKFADHYAYLTSVIFRDHDTGEMEVISRDRSVRFVFPFSKDFREDSNSNNYEIDI